MIESTSPSDPASRLAAYSGDLQSAGARRFAAAADSFSPEQARQLTEALNQDPETRPDVVARGRLLAADPNYPPATVISHVAAQIVNAPDLSEDGS